MRWLACQVIIKNFSEYLDTAGRSFHICFTAYYYGVCTSLSNAMSIIFKHNLERSSFFRTLTSIPKHNTVIPHKIFVLYGIVLYGTANMHICYYWKFTYHTLPQNCLMNSLVSCGGILCTSVSSLTYAISLPGLCRIKDVFLYQTSTTYRQITHTYTTHTHSFLESCTPLKQKPRASLMRPEPAPVLILCLPPVRMCDFKDLNSKSCNVLKNESIL